MAVFNIQNQWGGNSAPWNEGGVLNIGNRVDQPLLALSIQSSDGGLSFTGTQTYQGEGPIGLRATRVTENTYNAENQWGGTSAPWHDAGVFLLGAREGQNAIAFDISSTDGETLTGTMTYDGEGPIGVKGVRSAGLAFDATNQWGGASAPWHQGGQWVLGCRPDQSVTALDLTSADDGKTVTGTMIYAGEGPIGFRGTRIMANTYAVDNQWGGNDAPWNAGGTWVLGCRGKQGILDVTVEGDGERLTGTMVYTGEGPIGLALSPSIAKVPMPA
ncbi:lectin OAA family protein [Sphingomonas sp. Leaf242]|uniref:lectin OAA family protein n=1 Tax=Sphingomonas sp. Leaf242 TaxID=1736304 RepID=UPI000713D68F|nr:hypothetical protein [Sphingomonas sp. Leaf242]KQO05641.1 lectin ESA-2 [Sphingomonas sp. Leaf242]